MANRGDEVLARRVSSLWRAMADLGASPLGLLLDGKAAEARRHYPQGDAYDSASGTQFYYHVHRLGEHGHIHLFQRAKGMPASLLEGRGQDRLDNAVCHLVAVGLGADGNATELFTTNRWVTGESWWDAAQVGSLLPGFRMAMPGRLEPLAAWLEALVHLHADTIAGLLDARDRRVRDWQDRNPDLDAREDGGLEITSRVRIEPLG